MNTRAKVILGLPLTARERAEYLLFIASEEEVQKFLEKENDGEGGWYKV